MLASVFEHSIVPPLFWCIATTAATFTVLLSANKHKHLSEWLALPLLRFCSHTMGVSCSLLPLLAWRVHNLGELHFEVGVLALMWAMTALLAIMATAGVSIHEQKMGVGPFVTGAAAVMLLASFGLGMLFAINPIEPPYGLDSIAQALARKP